MGAEGGEREAHVRARGRQQAVQRATREHSLEGAEREKERERERETRASDGRTSVLHCGSSDAAASAASRLLLVTVYPIDEEERDEREEEKRERERKTQAKVSERFSAPVSSFFLSPSLFSGTLPRGRAGSSPVTLAPWAARWCAMPRPKPRAPPKTIILCPAKSIAHCRQTGQRTRRKKERKKGAESDREIQPVILCIARRIKKEG